VLSQQRFGQPNGALAASPGAEHERHELGVSERIRPEA